MIQPLQNLPAQIVLTLLEEFEVSFYYEVLLVASASGILQLWAEYRIYPKYSDTSTPYHKCSKI